MWRKIEPRKYDRTISAAALIQSFFIAYLVRASGLRAVAQRCGHLLGTKSIASISQAVRRASSLRLAQAMLAILESTHKPGDNELVAIDGMAVTLPKTQRHQCKKYNDKTVGGGVVWTYMINVAQGVCPVKILKIVEGAWHDSKVMRGVKLIPKGPVYLMDRGFYALELLEEWLDAKVRFIVRVKERSLVYEQIRTITKPRSVGDKFVALDAIVRLGGPRAKAHPIVRLVIAILASGEKLILATDRLDWSVDKVLAAYKKRWHIERFHRCLKDTIGLAHLYSFHQRGIMFMLHVALLLALVLLEIAQNAGGETIKVLHRVLTAIRQSLGLGTRWKRNMCAPRRTKKKSKRARE